MIVTSSSLNFATTTSSREREELIRQSGLRMNTHAQGVPVAQASRSMSRDNVLLQVAQSSYLYSRSALSSSCAPGQGVQPAAVQVHTREEALQSLVTHAFSREIQIRSTTTINPTPSTEPPTLQGHPVGIQATATLSRAYRFEQEQHSVMTIEGSLQLADNRSVEFVVQTRMDSRLSFQSASGQFSQTVVRTDPLILNLYGGAAQLTDTAFHFDIDADGRSEAVSFATGGSGFIAFDRNGDGRINDGSELFGSRSGDGFADLAQHDDDGNGFIDSNDAIYAKLKFFARDEHGNDTLRTLSDVGVAAIRLQSAHSPATLRGSAGQELGSVRSTGIYVMQSGAVGTVQQVDLASRDLKAEQDFSDDFDNAQFIEAAPVTSDAEAPVMDDAIKRLQAVQADFMARLDAMKRDEEHEEFKSTLQLLVDGLDEQLKQMHKIRENHHQD